MKKLLIILLSLLFVVCAVAFTGCSNKNSGNKDNDSIGNIEHIHNYTPFITPPSCTEKGFTKYTCTCGNNYIDNFVVELGHNFTIYISNNDATYDKDGTKTAICSNANCTATDTIIDTGSKLCDKEMSPFVCSGDTITGLTENGLNKTTLIIPEEIAGVEIKKIADYAFSACLSLTSVTIPNTITTIGDNAFYNCSKLTSITIGNSVTSIGNSAFYNCDSLTSITIPDSVTSIGEDAFAYCDSLTSVNYTGTIDQWAMIDFKGYSSTPLYYADHLYIDGEEVTDVNLTIATYISNYAFYNCSSLTSVTIGNSVTNIGNEVFRNCYSLTSVTIGNSVTSIGEDAFYNCSSLTSVTVDENNTAYASVDGILYNKNKTEFIHIPKGIIGEVTIPDTITSIGDWAFEDCSSLTSVIIGDSITSIGNNAFFNCNSLTSITIPDSVTSIGNNAFYNCDSLKKVNYTGTIDQWAMIDFKGYDSNPLYYAKHLYINEKEVTEVNLTTVTYISNYAFYNCDSLTSITIPNSVTSIGDYAFSGCNSLTSVTFADTSTWYYTSYSSYTGGSTVDVINPTQNSIYLTSTYNNYYWYKK